MQSITYQDHAETFWDRIAPNYAKQPIRDLDAYEEKVSYVRGLLKAKDRILEIGCGTGGTALRLAPFVSEVVATDISRAMIEIAKSKLESDTAGNVRFKQSTADDRVSDQPFNAICAFSLLHLVDDIDEVLSSVWHQLEPGGLFISKTVCLKEAPSIVRVFVRLLTAFGIAPQASVLSKAELIRHLEKAGFEIEAALHFGKQGRNPFIVARKPKV